MTPLVTPHSLAVTLDTVDKALFDQCPLSGAHIEETMRWLIGRQTLTGPEAGMFAPTEADLSLPLCLFSGEKLHTRLAVRHVLTAEAARALLLLGTGLADVHDMLTHTHRWLTTRCFADSCQMGECAHSGIALLRYLAAGGEIEHTPIIERRIQLLSQRRDGRGRWTGYPFYYTMLALGEVNHPAARAEIAYALPACERAAKRLQATTTDRRRQAILQRALAALPTLI